MSQNIYDNQTFFDGYAQLSRSVQGLDGAPEWPTIRSILPDLQGKRWSILAVAMVGSAAVLVSKVQPRYWEWIFREDVGQGERDDRRSGD